MVTILVKNISWKKLFLFSRQLDSLCSRHKPGGGLLHPTADPENGFLTAIARHPCRLFFSQQSVSNFGIGFFAEIIGVVHTDKFGIGNGAPGFTLIFQR